MTFYYKIIVALSILAVLVLVVPAQAAPSWWPIVPCGLNNPPEGASGTDPEGKPLDYTKPCSRCDFFKLLKNLIDFVFFGLAPILGTLWFVLAGIYILLAGSNITSVVRGKQIFWITVQALVIIAFAWLITNTLIRSLGAKYNGSDNWWQFTCTEEVKPPIPAPAPPSEALCDNPAELAKNYSEPYPFQNSPELNALISCIKGKTSGLNLGEESSFDKSNPLCNYTRGNAVCSEKCSHTVNSCHYGGRSGTQGAMAVDFGSESIGNTIIRAALECSAKSARCETSSGKTIECSDPNATHVHVNSKSCDAN